jgi:hypothetical protein
MKLLIHIVVGALILTAFYFSAVEPFWFVILVNATDPPTGSSIAAGISIAGAAFLVLGAFSLAIGGAQALQRRYTKFNRWMQSPAYQHYPLSHVFSSAYCTILAFAILYFLVSTHFDAFNKPLNFVSSLYFSIVTFATVGYGDIYPVSPYAQLLVSCEIMLSLAYIVFLFSLAANYLIESRRKDKP